MSHESVSHEALSAIDQLPKSEKLFLFQKSHSTLQVLLAQLHLLWYLTTPPASRSWSMVMGRRVGVSR